MKNTISVNNLTRVLIRLMRSPPLLPFLPPSSSFSLKFVRYREIDLEIAATCKSILTFPVPRYLTSRRRELNHPRRLPPRNKEQGKARIKVRAHRQQTSSATNSSTGYQPSVSAVLCCLDEEEEEEEKERKKAARETSLQYLLINWYSM